MVRISMVLRDTVRKLMSNVIEKGRDFKKRIAASSVKDPLVCKIHKIAINASTYETFAAGTVVNQIQILFI